MSLTGRLYSSGAITTVDADAGRISAVTEVDDAGDGWLVPGFVDTHGHGGGGADFATTDPAEVRTVLATHRAHGTTTSYASLVTADLDTLCAQVRTLAPLVGTDGLAGIHLEGPFLSLERKGAHNPDLLLDPTPARIDALLEAADGAIRMITLAPERSGGLDAIRRFTEAGVVVAFGHSDADATLTRQAIDAGATVVTHAFNAMRSIHHRDPGPLPALLTDERVLIELICDGVHVHRDVVAMAIETAGVERVALVTDAMGATGMPDGRYPLGSLTALVVDGVARLETADGSPGSIAGSTLTMDAAVAFVMTQVGCTAAEAAQLSSINAARHHCLDAGTIALGRPAAVCLIDSRGTLRGVMA